MMRGKNDLLLPKRDQQLVTGRNKGPESVDSGARKEKEREFKKGKNLEMN